ncbi:putative glyoxalase superfamily metalloenzyme YdcJ [Streptomyces sp. SLBN-118]|uniref:2-oxoadipate dioxygenase/decarboxylase n=1 Tax=Streptomyces sp. SLBN-118 TaxID=2768454 RepID=UPI0011502C4D|nr:VOC family protein [Streptomyces sp. SLBN-118]TQK43085.1 putative glyoxalase superfamily metalloenzyme YdcJ [Streptomyces sp. SLBN-118]
MLPTWWLRAAFARRLSDMYGAEVPAYTTLLQVSVQVNDEVIGRDGDAGRLGGIERVTAERHGAIRVGTPREMRQVAQIFAALGMRPVGFYDLREAAASSVPVVSTAFRPIDAEELERNPFRVFTSMLTTADRRFFDADLQARLESFLGRRELFPPELLDLAARAEREQGLDERSAERFLTLAVAAFELSPEPVDRAWYTELERISAVAADIGGVASTHINHLTPRVLDIDELYRRMGERGITMIDRIQGPPRWNGPDVLLRQTSFRALAEGRRFREPDGSITQGALRVRFGEVEARGIALTRAGRALYDELTGEPAEVWEERFPRTEGQLAVQQRAFFRYEQRGDRPRDGRTPPDDLAGLLDGHWVNARPIVYEDFLPKSAAGIFQSNLSDEGTRNAAALGTHYDQQWLSGVLERPVHDPFDLYAAQQDSSLRQAREALGLPKDRP